MLRLEADSGRVEAKHFSNDPPSIYLRGPSGEVLVRRKNKDAQE